MNHGFVKGIAQFWLDNDLIRNMQPFDHDRRDQV